jgi:arylformamidase
MTNRQTLTQIIEFNGKKFSFDILQYYDLSISLDVINGPRAWYQGDPVIDPVRIDSWVGEVKKGAGVNFRNITFNPHAQMTHTESFGHISEEIYSVNQIRIPFLMPSKLISVKPEDIDNDLIITAAQLKPILEDRWAKALLIRTIPNDESKKNRQYSNTNPPYLSSEAGRLIVDSGIEHLLIDTPSVDKEKDDGLLSVHHIFWNYPEEIRVNCTITELFFAASEIPDGAYLLSLQVGPFENDAAPSRPLIFPGKFL